jgi:DUF4097 and DUF4098 domain-containing protein YvlB
MNMRTMRTAIFAAGIVFLGTLATNVQAAPNGRAADNEGSLTCDARNSDDSSRRSVAEPREQVVAQASVDKVNASPNGSVTIHGTERSDVRVKSCVYATAPTEEEAKQLASQVKAVKGAGEIEPDGPRTDHNHHWSVSYEIWLPTHSSITISTVNGSIRVEHVDGNIKTSSVNGGLHLDGLAGEVRASTVNGGIRVQLSGAKWQGTGLEVSTTNGGVHFEVPDGYAANVEASTVNGGMHCDFPISLQGAITKHLSFQLGGGGPEIRTSTVNGGIRFSRGA